MWSMLIRDMQMKTVKTNWVKIGTAKHSLFSFIYWFAAKISYVNTVHIKSCDYSKCNLLVFVAILDKKIRSFLLPFIEIKTF